MNYSITTSLLVGANLFCAIANLTAWNHPVVGAFSAATAATIFCMSARES